MKKVNENFHTIYTDSDGDEVSLCTEDDFSIMLEECEDMKSIRLDVKENPEKLTGSYEEDAI